MNFYILEVIVILINFRTSRSLWFLRYGADVNALDNYNMTPIDRLASNHVSGIQLLQSKGGRGGRAVVSGAGGTPKWDADKFDYKGGVGEGRGAEDRVEDREEL
jgi:hypothetical protein